MGRCAEGTPRLVTKVTTLQAVRVACCVTCRRRNQRTGYAVTSVDLFLAKLILILSCPHLNCRHRSVDQPTSLFARRVAVISCKVLQWPPLSVLGHAPRADGCSFLACQGRQGLLSNLATLFPPESFRPVDSAPLFTNNTAYYQLFRWSYNDTPISDQYRRYARIHCVGENPDQVWRIRREKCL